MKKIFLILLIGIIALSSVFAGGSQEESEAADSSKTYHLRMSTLASEGLPLYDSCVWYIERVAELTDGAVEIELYPSSQLGDYSTIMGELILGTVDLSWESANSEYDSRLTILGSPYLVSNWDEVKYAYAEGSWLTDYIGDVSNELGITQMGVSPGGFYGIAGNDLGNLDTLFDLDIKQDALCRVPPNTLAIKTVEALTYNTTQINYSDLYSALQTGVADCWYGGSVDLNYEHFRDVIKNYAAFDYANEYYPLFISNVSLKKLPENYQKAMLQAGWEASAVAYDKCVEAYEGYFTKLEDFGIKIHKPTDKEMAAIVEKVREEVWPDISKLIPQEDLDDLYAFTKKMKADLNP